MENKEPFLIRTAVPGDLETLLGFEQGIVAAERPFDSTLREGTIHYYDLGSLLLSPLTKVLVAQLGNQVIGSGFARIETAKPYLKLDRYAYLGFMYVEPAYRGLGVNRAILNGLKEWAVSQEIYELRLEVYQQNEPARKAYEKAGFSAHVLEMRMRL